MWKSGILEGISMLCMKGKNKIYSANGVYIRGSIEGTGGTLWIEKEWKGIRGRGWWVEIFNPLVWSHSRVACMLAFVFQQALAAAAESVALLACEDTV